jgi:hypothetical protein
LLSEVENKHAKLQAKRIKIDILKAGKRLIENNENQMGTPKRTAESRNASFLKAKETIQGRIIKLRKRRDI